MNLVKKLLLAGLAVSLPVAVGCEHQLSKKNGGGAGGKKLVCVSGAPCGQGPGPGKHYGQADARHFEIYIYSDPTDPTGKKCLVDLNTVTLWKQDVNHQPIHQEVTWVSDDGREYTVFFPNSNTPFGTDTFHVRKDGEQSSGKPAKSGYYEYSIYSGDVAGNTPGATPCMNASDPGVHVNP